jgi:hypothetical protein
MEKFNTFSLWQGYITDSLLDFIFNAKTQIDLTRLYIQLSHLELLYDPKANQPRSPLHTIPADEFGY